MVRELSKDAVLMKLHSKFPNILISEYEYSYAAGLAMRYLKVPETEALKLKELMDFEELKKTVNDRIREESFSSFADGEKLKEMLLSCIIEGKINEESIALYEMGLYNK